MSLFQADAGPARAHDLVGGGKDYFSFPAGCPSALSLLAQPYPRTQQPQNIFTRLILPSSEDFHGSLLPSAVQMSSTYTVSEVLTASPGLAPETTSSLAVSCHAARPQGWLAVQILPRPQLLGLWDFSSCFFFSFSGWNAFLPHDLPLASPSFKILKEGILTYLCRLQHRDLVSLEVNKSMFVK